MHLDYSRGPATMQPHVVLGLHTPVKSIHVQHAELQRPLLATAGGTQIRADIHVT